MPELAEVEFYRRQWDKASGQKILSVHVNGKARVLRGTDVAALEKTLRCASMLGSEAHGKQLMFRFSNGGWLGVHLGMTGDLLVEPADAPVLKHDHLVLRQATQSLVFRDPRQFGRLLFHKGKEAPDWWQNRAVEILSPQFTLALVQTFLSRHARAPIKAILLMQNGFPGVGNWMADEILWRSKIHPNRPAGRLRGDEVKRLHAQTRFVCRQSMRIVGLKNGDLPKSWLFQHRWEKGGKCPVDGSALRREEIGGRTTCWCPSCQKRR